MAKLTEAQRKKVILDAAVRIVKSHGLGNVAHGSVAKEATRGGIATSKSIVVHWFPTKNVLWDAVILADRSKNALTQAKALGYRK